jgi:hypothetical protein
VAGGARGAHAVGEAASETERAWLGAASGQTVHQVERLVSGHRAGDLPSAPKTAGAERHVLRFEVSGEVLATFREALTKLRRDAEGSLDDDAALLLMARHVLGGPVDEGRASYQVAITVCEACQRTTQTGGGEAVELTAEVAAMARCDAQILPRAHMGPAEHAHMRQAEPSHKATQRVPPAVRRAVLRASVRLCLGTIRKFLRVWLRRGSPRVRGRRGRRGEGRGGLRWGQVEGRAGARPRAADRGRAGASRRPGRRTRGLRWTAGLRGR